MTLAYRTSRQSTFKLIAKVCLITGKVFLWLGFGFGAVSLTAVAMFKWINPLSSAIQLQRQWEASGDWHPQHLWVDWEHISASMSLAVIASEDQQFLQHHGFDTVQIQKAIEASQRGDRLRGASTISQQTAKNIFLWNGRSFVRKGLEAWFTLLIELCWSKQRILEVYLNSVEFGTGIFGIEAASQHYFRKSARRLNRYEAALLAAVLPNPHRMIASDPSPYMRERQAWIMRQMSQLGGEGIIGSLER
jgi:monofunctional biosynthetic peptidoglycan transglycosylase